jgi:hypothetical protein
MRTFIHALLFSMTLLGACQMESDVSRQGMRTGQQENIREAAFRYLFHHNASGLQQTARAFCLSIQERDPTPAFLERFHDERISVLPLSACSQEGWRGVHVRKSGDEAIWFDLAAQPYWSTNFEVFIDGSYYEAPLSSAGYTWRLVRHNISWGIASGRMLWIS